LLDQARHIAPLGGQPEFPAHAGLAGALSRLLERPGDDERRAPDIALPVVERLARDLTGRRP
jgi:hypothetical protein